MQKMSCLFSLVMANTTPHESAAGMAGGTVMKIISSVLSRRMAGVTPTYRCLGIVATLMTIATTAMIATNFNPSV